MNYITCFTGHRPEAFTWGTDKADPKCKILFNRLEDAIDDLIAKGCTHFIAGNALGIDTWASEIVLEKKEDKSKSHSGNCPALRRPQCPTQGNQNHPRKSRPCASCFYKRTPQRRLPRPQQVHG